MYRATSPRVRSFGERIGWTEPAESRHSARQAQDHEAVHRVDVLILGIDEIEQCTRRNAFRLGRASRKWIGRIHAVCGGHKKCDKCPEQNSVSHEDVSVETVDRIKMPSDFGAGNRNQPTGRQRTNDERLTIRQNKLHRPHLESTHVNNGHILALPPKS